MVRPAVSEWESVFGFSDDPTPGDADILEKLANSYRSVANNAGDALPLVSQLENQQVGEGKSMEKLRDKLGDLANQVRKLHSSYDQAAGALKTYVHVLHDTQKKADDALEDGRKAKDRLDAATEVVRAAGADISRLDGAMPPPDEHEARQSAKRALDEATNKRSTAQGKADAAQDDLDAARLLAEDAREVREDAAGVAARALDDARDEAVPGKSIWEKIRDTLGFVFGIIGGVLGILAMLIPGLQGLGLALTIGSFVFSGAAFGISIAKSIETGEWDPLDMVLNIIGLGLGAGAIFKAGAKIGTLLKGIPGEFKEIPGAFKSIPTNIGKSLNSFKDLPGEIGEALKGIGSKIDDLKWLGQVPKNPMGALSGALGKTITAFLDFKNLPIKMPPIAPMLGIIGAWSRTEVAGFFLGVAGFIYGPAANADHKVPPAHDGSYLPGTT
ncbi:hypothetical protein GTY65_09435 [Streptomyces sp. SID8379]|uniref:putative T7SS-secreted protein n=1 Tax=unclassified Streptomyces TaxID=2593676 RepID=UPI0003643D2C|nr:MULTISPECIES: hypothetical protein [unclassified Streptomyces]MYW64294.1 hypothetical protein [Streptomyces sp. SID8379]